jgi:hypothetical protein
MQLSCIIDIFVDHAYSMSIHRLSLLYIYALPRICSAPKITQVADSKISFLKTPLLQIIDPHLTPNYQLTRNWKCRTRKHSIWRFSLIRMMYQWCIWSLRAVILTLSIIWHPGLTSIHYVCSWLMLFPPFYGVLLRKKIYITRLSFSD